MIELSANLLEDKRIDKPKTRFNQEATVRTYDRGFTEEELDNDVINVDCIMNNACIFEEVEYTAYSCPTCPEKLTYICQPCFHNCHSGHVSQNKGSPNSIVLIKTVSIKNQKCQCALHNHMQKKSTKKSSYKQSDRKMNNYLEEDNVCPLNEIISVLQPLGYFFDTIKKKYMCIYCAHYCQETENLETNLPKNFQILNPKETPKCCCNNEENHFPIAENLNCLLNIMKNRSFDKYINRYKFPYLIFNNDEFLSKYFDPYFKKQTDFLRLNLTHKIHTLELNDDKEYNQCLQVLNGLCEVFSSKLTFYKLFPKLETMGTFTKKVYETFDLEFLLKLFSIPEVDNDPLLKVKLNCLNLYRKFIFSPDMIKCRNFNLLETMENVTPFHRLLLGFKPPEELVMFTTSKLNVLKIKKNKYENLLEKIFNSIINYSEKSNDESEYTLLAVEYLKIWNLIIPFLSIQPDSYKPAFQRIAKIISILKNKKANEFMVRNTLEKIVYQLILLNNDHIFYSALFDKENNRKFEFTIDSNLKFSFQNDPFNKDLITILFSYAKEDTDNSSYILRKEIYDILVNKNDCYIIYLKNLFNSNFKLFNFQFLDLATLDKQIKGNEDKFLEFMKNSETLRVDNSFCGGNFMQNLLSTQNDQNQILLNKLKTVKAHLNALENLFLDMIYSKISEGLYLTKMEDQLKHLSQYLKIEFFNLDRIANTNKILLFKKQLLFYKIGGMDLLINICKLLKKVKYFHHDDNLLRKHKLCINQIFIILDQLCFENPFFCAILFSQSMVKLLIRFRIKNSSNCSELKFYYEKLKILNKYNYKINSEFFITTLVNEFDFNNWKNECENGNSSEKFILYLKTFIYLLKVTDNKSIMVVNEKISHELYTILSSVDFTEELENLTEYLISITKNNTETIFRNLSQVSLNLNINLNTSVIPGNNYEPNNQDDSDLMISDENPVVYTVKLVYMCIDNVKDEFFYLFINDLHIQEISHIMSLHYSVEPELRRTITKAYCRYLIESHFMILPEVNNYILNEYSRQVDINLEAKIVNKELVGEDERVNTEGEIEKVEKCEKIPDAIMEIDEEDEDCDTDRKVQSNKIVTPLITQGTVSSMKSPNYTKKYSRSNSLVLSQGENNLNSSSEIKNFDIDINFIETTKRHTELLRPILRNFEKYRVVTYYFEKEFKENFKLVIRYFEDCILSPSIYSIYKILYFAESIPAQLRYTVYSIIILFLNCYKHFIEMIKKFNLEDTNIIQILEGFIKIPPEIFNDENNNGFDRNNQPPQSEGVRLKKFTDKVLDELQRDILTMNSDSYEQLNLKNILEVYFNHVKHFELYRKLILHENHKDNLESLDLESGLFFNNLKILIEHYDSLKENFEENILFDIYSINTEKEPEIETVKNTIALDLLFKIEAIQNTKLPLMYNEENSIIIECINKLFKTDPNTWQTAIVNSATISKDFIKSFIKEQIPFLFQFIFIEFNKLETNKDSHFYEIFLNMLEFLRLLCEDHNKLFQTILIDSKIDENPDNETLFISLILKLPIIVLTNVQNFKTKKDYLKYFKTTKTEFFGNLVVKITDFMIEVVQGAFGINFTKIAENPVFSEYYEAHYKCLDIVQDDEDFEILMANFFRFINCFIEENSNKIGNKINLIRKLNPQKLLNVLMTSFKNLYIKNCVNEETLINLEIKHKEEMKKELPILNKYEGTISFAGAPNISSSHKEQNLYPNFKSDLSTNISHLSNATLNHIFTYNCHLNLINFYIKNEKKFLEEPLFIISSGIFVYYKRTSNYRSSGLGEKAKKILEVLDKLTVLKKDDAASNSKNKLPWIKIIKCELYNFFRKIVKDVELSYTISQSVDESEFKKYKIFFEKDDKAMRRVIKFSENSGTVTEDIIGVDTVIFLVNPLSLFFRNSDYPKFLEKSPYDNFNTKLSFILQYYSELSHTLQMRRQLWDYDSKILTFLFKINYGKMEVLCAAFSFLTCILTLISISYDLEIIEKLTLLLRNNSLNKEVKENHIERNFILQNPYKYYINTVSIIHQIILLLTILNWLVFTTMKHFKFSNLNFPGKIKTLLFYLTLLMNGEIFPFVWNFFFGGLALISENLSFLFALQMFTIFNISPTMSSVLYAVRIRYKQFASTFFLLIILMLFYASVTFFFFRDELYDKQLKENICETFLQCFLYLVNYGIRSGEGVHFGLKSITEEGYWTEFIYAWIFYFIVILIVLNIINGIIVDTFQALREQNNQKENVRENVCFICSLNRARFEIKGINFDFHREKEHNVLSYFEFLLKINFTDEHDLNSLETDVLNSIRSQRTDFFPVKKSKCLEQAD